MARMLDLLINTIGDENNTQFHLAKILTCDVDVSIPANRTIHF
ncbi:hypothetical protein C7431_102235 [Pantoea allii]|uniref:Uncharacterized protein n=1 Tax=Pantoea allii TaxID=574096 RepID=A0A2V2BJU3_9GAMM|nr:hypothetical protein C7431_102235 [Pantoea allii]